MEFAQDFNGLPRQRDEVILLGFAGDVAPFGCIKVKLCPLHLPQFTRSNEQQRPENQRCTGDRRSFVTREYAQERRNVFWLRRRGKMFAAVRG